MPSVLCGCLNRFSALSIRSVRESAYPSALQCTLSCDLEGRFPQLLRRVCDAAHFFHSNITISVNEYNPLSLDREMDRP